MHIFIDESGSFAGYHKRSLSAVGALAIPSGRLDFIEKKYAKMRKCLPIEKGEVKGRLLNENQIGAVVSMLSRNNVLFEITVVDLAFHNETDVKQYKQRHSDEMLSRVDRFVAPDRQRVEDACRQISRTSIPLYLQAITTFEVLHNLINHVPLYFSQREPHELAAFTWIIDGKEPSKVTNWETWWSWYAQGALANMSIRRPAMVLEGADYSFYDRFKGGVGDIEGTNTKLLLADVRFSAAAEPGLELVDIVVNATRRALVGTLGEAGWRGIPQLMIHRPNEPYIQFLIVGGQNDTIHRSAYSGIVNQFFTRGGKSMLAPRFLRAAQEGITG